MKPSSTSSKNHSEVAVAPIQGVGRDSIQELSILTDRLQKVNESLVRKTQARKGVAFFLRSFLDFPLVFL